MENYKRLKLKKLFISIDIIAVIIPYLLIYFIFEKDYNIYHFINIIFFLFLSLIPFLNYFNFKNFYKHQRVISFAKDIKIILKGLFLQFISFTIIIFFNKNFYFKPNYITLSFLLSIFLLIFLKFLVRKYQLKMRKQGFDKNNIILLGNNKINKIIMRKIGNDDRYGINILKIFSIKNILENKEKLYSYIIDNKIKEIIITNPSMINPDFKTIIKKLKNLNIEIYIVPDTFNIITNMSIPYKIGKKFTLLKIIDSHLNGLNLILKKIIDLTLSLIILIITSPLIIVISFFIKLDSEGPIIYKQKRIGKKGKIFNFYKFRTMYVNADKKLNELLKYNEASGPIFKIKDDPRMTTFGKFLRKFSLDELPQLFNILKGDMSLIGPRPPLPSEIIKYEPWQKRRLSITPGLTGLWQVRGRSDLSFEEMVTLDIYYIENWSLGLDLYILLKTIPAVLLARGSY